MINISTVPDAKLYKRHNLLLFHFVRSMASRRYIIMLYIVSKYNSTNILTMHWGDQSTFHELIQYIFYHEGNTAAQFMDDTIEVDASFNE